ncbi:MULTISPECIES: Rv1355c family protein [unclassified Rhodococcus (in: high G+C Gram-positive bacteria)]|uniref:Rv1355c family protein n=1 Tax=unclassified Rhodococcus (in: high G+C Gram-positive bacteria) TaxID=192944 RepID=UPI00163A6B3D|nr:MULTISPECIES: Rv1355c family protein [unclassified Rhodococcus (in: high G+C Gram-positive bacteria)]MBC2642992.1 Rv1355c family protein [Rhodococcus sp. 3A]MBC2892266.1 Rv1355c family protein [Rhodococcus sp. 4CII]
MNESRGDYTALLLDEDHSGDAAVLDRLRRDPAVVFVDRLEHQRDSLRTLVPTPAPDVLDEAPVWVYYSWRRTVVRLLGPAAFRLLRLDRNRNKVTRQEQERLRDVTVGIVGLSVGHAVALALTLEGACGGLRLADFDTLELSNLNRVPGTVLDLGVNKAVVAARRIAEIDPYVTVMLWEDGLNVESAAEFLDGTDVVVDECDSLDVKVSLRREARRRGLPVLMATSDKGLLDVERFDLEPDRPIFHGVIGDVDVESLAGLGSRDKIPLVLQILDAAQLSATMAASLVEVDETISTWPQLGGEVLLGGAEVAAAVRRIALGQPLASGRCRMDVDGHLDALTDPPMPLDLAEPPRARAADSAVSNDADTVVNAATRAPSGGNVQPWTITADGEGVTISLAPEHTTAMDVEYRGSYVALGAALHNARIAASAAGLLGAVTVQDTEPGLAATMTFGSGSEQELTDRYEAMLDRTTNRRPGVPRSLDDAQAGLLAEAASREGARLCLVTDRDDIAAIGAILAESDRIRFLTPTLHREMIGELRWPPTDSVETGIDVRALELDSAELSTLALLRRPEVMEHLGAQDGGRALGKSTADRVASSSAIAVVAIPGNTPRDYVRGGEATESVWIEAQALGLAVQPISPVFLYGVERAELEQLSPRYAAPLERLRQELFDVVGAKAGEALALVLRLSHAPGPSVRSERRADRVQRRIS